MRGMHFEKLFAPIRIGCFARIFQGLGVRRVLNPESGIERYNPQYTRWAARRKGIQQRQGADRAPMHLR